MIKPRKNLHFNPTYQIKGDWMLVLTEFGVYNSSFNITEENKEFKLYKFPYEKSGGFSYIEVNQIEKDLDFSDITAAELQDDIIGPIKIAEYREQVTKRMEDVGYMNILAGYPSSVFQDLESYLRTEIDLVKDDIRSVLDEYNSSFITSDLQPGIYTFKDLSKGLCNILQPE